MQPQCLEGSRHNNCCGRSATVSLLDVMVTEHVLSQPKAPILHVPPAQGGSRRDSRSETGSSRTRCWTRRQPSTGGGGTTPAARWGTHTHMQTHTRSNTQAHTHEFTDALLDPTSAEFRRRDDACNTLGYTCTCARSHAHTRRHTYTHKHTHTHSVGLDVCARR